MNLIWAILMAASVVFLLFSAPGNVLTAFSAASNSALELSLKMAGIYAVWLGIMSLAEKCGLNRKLARLLKPVTRFLFGKTTDPAREFATLNMSANILGLGNAATPLGIQAANAMKDNTFALAMLMVLNATSIQLIPTTVISLRAELGSTAAGAILLPSILSTLVSTVIGVLLVFVFFKKDDKAHDVR